MRRRDVVILLGSAVAAWPLAARPQQAGPPVVGLLGASSHGANEPYTAAFIRGLSDLGFVEGQNLVVEYRWADGSYDRLPALAAELVGKGVAVIFTCGGQVSLKAAMAATSEIPVVFNLGVDPVSNGYVKSLSRPGGNVTGVDFLVEDIARKRFELLRELVPRATTTALLVNPGSPTSEAEGRQLATAAREVGQKALVLNVKAEPDIETAFATMVGEKADALLITGDAFLQEQRRQIADLAARHKVPSIYFEREFVAAGGLMSYGTPLRESYYQAGVYVGRILRGAKPADLPIVQSTRFELVINLKVARSLGLTVPQTLMIAADEVIE